MSYQDYEQDNQSDDDEQQQASSLYSAIMANRMNTIMQQTESKDEKRDYSSSLSSLEGLRNQFSLNKPSFDVSDSGSVSGDSKGASDDENASDNESYHSDEDEDNHPPSQFDFNNGVRIQRPRF
jgi:hypothetical protein